MAAGVRRFSRFAAVGAVCVFGQTFAQTGDQPVFRSATRLVQATAVVRDRDGKAIGSLAAEDFEVTDNGKRQAVSQFEVLSLARPRGPDAVDGRTAAAPPAESVPQAPNHFVAFVVDDQNLVPEQMGHALIPAIHRIAAMGPADRAAVVSNSGRMIVEFTSDKERLRAALSRLGSLDRRETFSVSRLNPLITCKITYLKADWIIEGDTGSLRNCVPSEAQAGPRNPALDRPIAGGTVGPPGEFRRIATENQVRAFAESVVQAGDRDTETYFAALDMLIDALSRMPGERSILLLSPGVYIPPRFRRRQDRLIADALRAKVVISGVDPRGVYVRDDPDDPSTYSDRWGIAETSERVAFMEGVTSGTGGRFVRGNNDIEDALRRLDSPPEFLYVLGFSPPGLRLDGKFHALSIRLKEGRGLAVDGRRGYYAVDVDPGGAADAQTRRRDAFFSGADLREIPLRTQVRTSQKPHLPIVLTAIVRIDVSGLSFEKDGAANRAVLTLGVGLFNDNGVLIKDTWKEVSVRSGDDELAKVRAGGVEVETDFDVPPGRYMVRVLASDADARLMGSDRTALIVHE